MGRFALYVLTFCVASLGILSSLWIDSISAAVDPVVFQADQALTQALSSGEKKSAAELCDTDFTWTDVDGKTRTKDETLGDLPAFASNNGSDAKVRGYSYSQLALLFGDHNNV